MVINFQNPNGRFPGESGEEYRGRGQSDADQNFIDESIEAEEETRRRRRQILRLLFRAAGMIALAAVFVIFIAYLASQRTYSSASYKVISTVTPTEDTQYLTLGNRIVYYSRDGANCLTGKGDIVWSITYEMQNPIARTAGDILAIGDYNGSIIYLQNAEDSLGTIDTSLPIRDLSVSESGEVAAVLADTDTTWIYLYNMDGTQIAYFKTTMGQSGYPVSIAVSPNGELVCVSHLLTTSSGISSSIAFYNFGNVGQNVAENNVSGFNYDNEIFPFTRFLSNSVCTAVSDSRIAFYNGKEIPQNGPNAMFTDELQGVWAGDDYVGLLFLNSASGGYSMQIYDAGGSLTNTVSFDMAYTDIHMSGDCIYINSESELAVYTVGGQLRYQGTFESDVSQVIPVSGTSNRLYIVTDSGLEEMRLQ